MSISKTIIDAGDTKTVVQKYDEVAIEYTGKRVIPRYQTSTDEMKDGYTIPTNPTARA